MENMRVGSSIKRITINDDPERVIQFNPTDILFVERFYQLMRDFESKEAKFEKRAKEIDSNQELDDHGIPVNLVERMALLREICEYFFAGIDRLFGENTSSMVFEGALSLEMIGEFFQGIIPFVQSVRSEKVAKYIPSASRKTRRVTR